MTKKDFSTGRNQTLGIRQSGFRAAQDSEDTAGIRAFDGHAEPMEFRDRRDQTEAETAAVADLLAFFFGDPARMIAKSREARIAATRALIAAESAADPTER